MRAHPTRPSSPRARLPANARGVPRAAQEVHTLISHFCPPSALALLKATSRFFYIPFRLFQNEAAVTFPLDQLQARARVFDRRPRKRALPGLPLAEAVVQALEPSAGLRSAEAAL